MAREEDSAKEIGSHFGGVVDIVRNSIAGNNLIEIRVNVFVTEKEINGPFSE